MPLKTAEPRRREQNCLCLRRGLSPEMCKAAALIHFPCLEGHSWEVKWSSQSHNTGFVGLFTLSCGVYVAIRITTIHLEGNRHLHISARAFRVCQESCTGGGLLGSSNTTHKSISTTLQIFSTKLMASELLTNLLGQEIHLSTFLAVSQGTGKSFGVRTACINTGTDPGVKPALTHPRIIEGGDEQRALNAACA